MVFWGKWGYSEFRPVCEHVERIFSSTNWWIGPKRYLVLTGRSNGSHIRASMAVLREHFPELLIYKWGAIWSGRPVSLIWPFAIFICGDIWNPVFMSTVREGYKTWRPTSENKLPIYQLIVHGFLDVGLFAVGQFAVKKMLVWARLG